MAFPFDKSDRVQSHQHLQAHLDGADWRCRSCSKLLGIRRRGRLEVRVHRHDYLVSLPVEATCPGCGRFNRT